MKSDFEDTSIPTDLGGSLNQEDEEIDHTATPVENASVPINDFEKINPNFDISELIRRKRNSDKGYVIILLIILKKMKVNIIIDILSVS